MPRGFRPARDPSVTTLCLCGVSSRVVPSLFGRGMNFAFRCCVTVDRLLFTAGLTVPVVRDARSFSKKVGAAGTAVPEFD